MPHQIMDQSVQQFIDEFMLGDSARLADITKGKIAITRQSHFSMAILAFKHAKQDYTYNNIIQCPAVYTSSIHRAMLRFQIGRR